MLPPPSIMAPAVKTLAANLFTISLLRLNRTNLKRVDFSRVHPCRTCRSCRSVQPFLSQKLRHQVSDLEVVQIRERKVRVATDSYFRQMHEGDIATMTIYGIPPEPRHGETNPPVILTRARRRLLRNVVSKVDDNGDLCEPREVREGYANSFECACRTRHRRRPFSFREHEVASRLVGNDGTDILVFYRGEPSWTATLRVGHEDSGPDLVEQSRNAIRDHPDVERPGIGRHGTEVLIEGFRIA